MRSKILFGVLAGLMLTLGGCSNKGGNEGTEEDQAYIREGNGEEKAVNTLQAKSTYRVVGPMEELREAVVEILGEAYWPDTMLSEEELAERTGISEYMYDSFLAEYQHAEAGIDMMILIEAKEEEIQAVEKYLNEYRELLLKIYEQQPQNKAKVFASRIEVVENHVCYIQLGADISAFEGQGEKEMIEYCVQENERALDVIEKRILGS